MTTLNSRITPNTLKPNYKPLLVQLRKVSFSVIFGHFSFENWAKSHKSCHISKKICNISLPNTHFSIKKETFRNISTFCVTSKPTHTNKIRKISVIRVQTHFQAKQINTCNISTFRKTSKKSPQKFVNRNRVGVSLQRD